MIELWAVSWPVRKPDSEEYREYTKVYDSSEQALTSHRKLWFANVAADVWELCYPVWRRRWVQKCR